MDPRFEQFITEKKYIANVSSATEEWYRHSLRWLPSPTPTDAELEKYGGTDAGKGPKSIRRQLCLQGRQFRSALGQRERAPNAMRAVLISRCRSSKKSTAFCLRSAWMTSRNYRGTGRKGFQPTRLHVFILTLVDIGCRSGEALGLRWAEVDFDNLDLMKLHGKGGKDRPAPFSLELEAASVAMEEAQPMGSCLPIA